MATKYVSSLTGPEMDAALIDMAYHNSEAYAVGTRNGVAVGSSDVTYHNNAKYYAEQTGADVQAAETAAARAEAAVPAGTAGAVFFDRAQSLTTAQQAQARANIMAGGSNDNLLDNAYFVGGGSQLGDGVFPINQRGQSSYSGAVIGMDRWRNNGNGTTVLNADNVTFSNTNGWKDGLNQRYAGNRFPLGSQVTFTVQMSDLSFNSCTITVPTTADTQTLDVQAGTSGVYFAVRTNNGYYSQAFVMCDPNTSASIRRAKVELGTVSTLANDAPPDYWQELEKCQHYLWVASFPSGSILSTGYASGDLFITDIILPTTMRATNLALTFNANVLIIGNGTAVVAASVIGVTIHGNHLRTYINPASALTNQNLYAFITSADTVMVVSAEL